MQFGRLSSLILLYAMFLSWIHFDHNFVFALGYTFDNAFMHGKVPITTYILNFPNSQPSVDFIFNRTSETALCKKGACFEKTVIGCNTGVFIVSRST